VEFVGFFRRIKLFPPPAGLWLGFQRAPPGRIAKKARASVSVASPR
jgi:hypothetical protein